MNEYFLCKLLIHIYIWFDAFKQFYRIYIIYRTQFFKVILKNLLLYSEKINIGITSLWHSPKYFIHRSKSVAQICQSYLKLICIIFRYSVLCIFNRLKSLTCFFLNLNINLRISDRRPIHIDI